MTGALVAAVGAALAYGAGSVLQAAGARRAVAAGQGLLGVTRQWPYLGGLGCDLGGWLLSLLALRRLPLFAVQAILAGSLAVTVLLAAAVLHVPPRRADTAAVVLIVAALAVLGAAAGAEGSGPVGAGVKEAGHPHVGEDEIRRAPTNRLQRRDSVGDSLHLPMVAEDLAEVFTSATVVLDDQHPRARSRRCSGTGGGRRRAVGTAGYSEPAPCSLAG